MGLVPANTVTQLGLFVAKAEVRLLPQPLLTNKDRVVTASVLVAKDNGFIIEELRHIPPSGCTKLDKRRGILPAQHQTQTNETSSYRVELDVKLPAC